jgi:DNA-binding XRE family transcriptional regulator
MAHATMTMGDETFVLVPQREYRAMVERTDIPPFPAPDANGNVPAVAYGRASIAREIILRREAVGLTQKALATAAGVRIETLNRVERAKVTPDTATIVKIDKALKRAESKLKKSGRNA